MVAKLTDSQFQVPEGCITHSLTQYTATIANHSTRAVMAGIGGATGLVQIPGVAGKIYTLYGLEITVKSTLTTVVSTGGLFEIFNDAIDWIPFQLLTNTSEVLGAAGGVPQSPAFIPVHKPLPSGSNITCFYTSLNAATDWASVTFFWSTREWAVGGEAQTYSAYGYGTARTSVATFVGDITVAIPANKGGKVVGFLIQCYGVIVTILSTGGNIAVHNQAALPSWEPYNMVTGSLTCIASGGGELMVTKIDTLGDAPGNSNFTFDTTTISTNSQVFGVCVVWEA